MLFVVLLVTNLLIFAIPGFIYLIAKVIGKYTHHKPKYRTFGYVSLFLALLWTVLALYGYCFGRFKYEVNEITLKDERLPDAFNGYRIVHISDLHLGGFIGHEAFVDTLVSVVNDLQPDLICFTGDLVSISHDEALPFVRSLRNLKARDGVVSILGNHDYGVYNRSSKNDEEREIDRAKLIDIQKDSLDWKLLLNENITIVHGQDSLCIVGLENQACGVHQKVRRGNLHKAMQGTDGSYRILLSHDPSQWDAEVVGRTDIPLTLSGHTHAMQFKVLGWTPCRWLYDRSDGLYQEGEQRIYVNIGLGELMPFRIGAVPEITVLNLVK